MAANSTPPSPRALVLALTASPLYTLVVLLAEVVSLPDNTGVEGREEPDSTGVVGRVGSRGRES